MMGDRELQQAVHEDYEKEVEKLPLTEEGGKRKH
jgi:hypothetical protein